jgi:hypothetical protein
MCGLPLQLEMHVRHLGLLYRLALGEASDTETVEDWQPAVTTVAQSVRSLVFPALTTLLATSGTPQRTFVPHSLQMPASDALYLMLSVMVRHDRHAAAQEQEQQQHLYCIGREQRAQWLRAAEAAAQTLQLLSQIAEVSRCHLSLPDEGGWPIPQPILLAVSFLASPAQ